MPPWAAPAVADSTVADVLPPWALEEIPGATVLRRLLLDAGRRPGFLWRATVQTLAYGAGHLTFWQLLTGAQGGGVLGDHLLRSLVSWAGTIGRTR